MRHSRERALTLVEHADEPTLKDLIDLLRRGFWLAVLAALLAAGGTYVVIREVPPTYQATATLVASAQDPNQRDFGTTLVTAPALDVATYRSAITSRPVLTEAYRELHALGEETPTSVEVARSMGPITVRAEDARVSSILRVQAQANDPLRARDIANAVAAAAVRWDEQRATRSLETIIASLNAQLASIDLELEAATEATPIEGLLRTRGELQLQLSSARALRTAAVGRLELLEPAEAPFGSIAPRPMRSAGIAGMFAVMAVYGLLLLRSALDTRVRSVEALGRLTGVPVLAEFPRVATGRRGVSPEAASHLRSAIGFATADKHPKVLLVTSAITGHGKSTVSIALAESFARLHYRTLLIDADLRKPVLGVEYGLDLERVVSLRKTLMDPDQLLDPVTIDFGRGIQLDLIPSFEAVLGPSELLSARMPALLTLVRERYDVIVIDSAPVLPVSDSLAIAPHCMGVLITVSVPAIDRRDLASTVDLMRRVGVPILGTVATNLPRSHRQAQRYGYSYGYGDGMEAMTPRLKPRKARASGAVRARGDTPSLPDQGAEPV